MYLRSLFCPPIRKIRARTSLALVKIALMSGETLAYQFLVMSQEKLERIAYNATESI